ncbi:MAG: HD domain-containing protein [Chloroflexota bacterium]|nr:HD domain-containing protein [Chloroflexota bacterium]
MDNKRLVQQLAFIVEIDRLKTVLRRSVLVDGTRRENSAEHSWHLAIMALLLAENTSEEVDVLHAVKMVLLHDIVEIDAGDTYAYDQDGYLDKTDRETLAANRLFGLLPADQGEEFRRLWEEFEAGETPTARFANALDRLQPLLLAYHSEGASWRDNQIRRAQVQARMAPIRIGLPIVWPEVERIIREAVAAGILLIDE